MDGSAATIESKTDIVDRINYGVIFRSNQDLFISREYWLHTFHVQLPKRFRLVPVPTCSNFSHCELLHNLALQVHSLHEGLLSEFNETIKSIRTLIPQTTMFGKNRKGRSLLPFIGKLSRGLFGTATMDDVNIMAGHINAISRKTNQIARALQQHGQHLSSFITVADRRMTNLMSGIKANSHLITNLAQNVNSRFQVFQHDIINISGILIKQVDKTNMLRSRLGKLELAVQSLVEGKITPFLIDRTVLSHVIRSIHSKLKKSYKQFYLTHTDVGYFYSNGKFVFSRNHSSLYITLKFPLSSQKLPLHLYKIISLPVPVNANSSSQMHATQLLSLPDYFAITPHHDQFIPLYSKDLVNCQHGSVILCDFNIALRPITVPDCTMALFSNNRQQIKSLCDFRFRPHLLQSDIIELSATSVLVYNSHNLILDCPKEQKIVPGCVFCIVHIPCRCSLSTNSMYFSPRLVNCYNQTSKYTMVHPVNLALLQEFFDDSKLMSIFGETTFQSPINLSVPVFNMYNHSFSSIIANDQKAHLSLKKMAAAAKKEQKVFKSLAEPLIDGLIDIAPSWPTTNDIMSLVAVCVGALAIVSCIFMFCKLRKMSVALLVLQQVQNASTATVPSFVYDVPKAPVSTSEPIIDILFSEFSWAHASVIIGIVVIIIMSIVLWLLWRLKSNQSTYLALELTSGGNCVVVPIMFLSLCPSYYRISQPVIRDVSIESFPNLKLKGTWSPFTVTDKRTGKSMPVPCTVDLGLWSYFRVKKILQQPFSAYILIVHNSYAFPVIRQIESDTISITSNNNE